MDFEDRENRYILEFNSFKLGSSDKWCPKVLVKDIDQNKVMPILWDAELDSEEDANEYAITMINDYLAKNL